MRTSDYLLSTSKETPTDAVIISHQLMLRAGLIRRLTSGIYSWLPLGLRVLNKVANIVRTEMNRVGGQEILLPAIQPADLWQETGRWNNFTPPLLKLKDRHQRDYCFGPTHEEVITDLMRHELHSYKQLPSIFYQIQHKFRDELRPRSGVMRAREFIMKDAYSFNADTDSLEKTYTNIYQAYVNIFTRLGLNFRAVLADTGSIGGSTSHEFQVLTPSGEDLIAVSDSSDYAANIELASALEQDINPPKPNAAMQMVATPGKRSIAAVCDFLNVPPTKAIKVLLIKGSAAKPVALILRGDHELNETKAEKFAEIAAPLTFVTEQEIQETVHCKPGYIGPVGLDIPMIIDRDAAQLSDFICGANQDNQHWQNVNWERDAPLTKVADLRKVVEGDLSPDGKGKLKLIRGIEVGHIFQLGDKYSKPMHATVLNEAGQAIPVQMGCYGLGVSRVVSAAIEQHHDAHGIIWPQPMAPFDIALIPINMHKSMRLREAIEKIYRELLQLNFDVLFDDRKERPGAIFADMDLIGIPHRLVLSERSLDAGTIEYKARTDTQSQAVTLDKLVEFLNKKINKA